MIFGNVFSKMNFVSEKRQKRLDGKRKKIEAEYRLFASSGKSTIEISSSSTMEELTELKKKRDAAILPRFSLKHSKIVDLEELHALILYSILGYQAPRRPHWCDLSPWRQISQTIFVIIDHSGSIDDQKSKDFEFLQGNFQRRFDVEIPTEKEKFYDGFLRARMSIVDQLRTVIKNREKSIGFSKLDLILSPIDMAIDDFPLPAYYSTNNEHSDYVYSRHTYSRLDENSPIYAIDCEMCITKPNRREVTRVSIVDEQCRVVMDTLVKPRYPIVDYLTKFSGITPAMMGGVKTTLADVQKKMERLLEPNAILCGHSLNFDLHALKIFHPFVIDTSVAYNLSGRRKQKSALRVLTSTFLDGMTIQQSDQGHCSVEDSYATMRLLKKKLSEAEKTNGPHFGNILEGWDFIEFMKSAEIRKRKANVEEDDEEEPVAKRPKMEDTKAVCGGCGEKIKFNCRNETCSCRVLARAYCMRCGENRGIRDVNEIDAESIVREYFPALPTGNLTQSNIAHLLKKGNKEMLWVRRGDQSSGPSMDECRKIKHLTIPEARNVDVVAELRSRMYEYDLNILELSASEPEVDKRIEEIVRLASSKALVCVLFCDREQGGPGRCYVKVKE